MKLMRIAAVASAAALLLTGCQKSSLDTMTGSYTYKTSGSVRLVPSALAALSKEELAGYKMMGGTVDTVLVALSPEQGQMNIVVKDKDSDKVLVSWNDVLGNVCTCDATVDGVTLTLDGASKSAQLTDGENSLGGGFVSFGGIGTLYDNMLIIPMEYQGGFTVSGVSMTVVASEVQCVAKAN